SRTKRMKRLMFARSMRSGPGSQIGLFIDVPAKLDMRSCAPSAVGRRAGSRTPMAGPAAKYRRSGRGVASRTGSPAPGRVACGLPGRDSAHEFEQGGARHRAVVGLAAAAILEGA